MFFVKIPSRPYLINGALDPGFRMKKLVDPAV